MTAVGEVERMKKILIVGGGIAGLAAARVLSSKGFSTTVVEKTQEWRPVGGGIYIPGNGVAALDAIGLGEKARLKGSVIDHRHIMSGKGKHLMRLDLEKVWGRPAPCLGILRRDLHEILFDGLESVDVRLGTSITSFSQDEQGVDVTLNSGDVERYDLLIGADGLNSSVRELAMGKTPIRRVGDLCCRFVIERPKNLNEWTLYAGKKSQFLMIPMTSSLAYVYVGGQSKEGDSLTEENFLDPFYDFPDPVSSICKSVDKNDLIWSSLDELAPLDTWGNRRVVLMGDAAHAMPPFMAQGASLALEDALIFGDVLSGQTDWSSAAETFTERRKSRVSWAIERNRRREKLTKIPYWVSSIGLKLVGEKTWIEDYSVLAKPLEMENE